jgi:hypothetical protein
MQVGIQRVVCEYDTSPEDVRWTESFAHSQAMFIEAGVDLFRINE